MPHFTHLRELHKIVMSLPKRAVDMDTTLKDHERVDFDKVKAGQFKECGAVACAMGWAALSPYFRERGFKRTRKGDLKLHGQEIDFDDAACELFDMTTNDVYDVFGSVRDNDDRSADQRNLFDKRLKMFFK